MSQHFPPAHGGNLAYAQSRFGNTFEFWQDLSTGISPWTYPAPPVPTDIWQRLPGKPTALLTTAETYYSTRSELILALPGSQYAIQRIARCFTAGKVAIPRIGYREHAKSWRQAGHELHEYDDAEQLHTLVKKRNINHAIVINPNNPSTETISPIFLAKLHDEINGCLLVDEAFIDVNPTLSTVPYLSECCRLFVLRSMGKFFGLAGLRLGFLLGQGKPLQILANELDCWAVSNPASWLGAIALKDDAWHETQRKRIISAQQTINKLLVEATGNSFHISGAGLFTTLFGNREQLYKLYCHLANNGVFTRWCYDENEASFNPHMAWLRIGLPPDNGEKLANALQQRIYY